jgi:UTP--glucose-1-phosphate uridylyltransferase
MRFDWPAIEAELGELLGETGELRVDRDHVEKSAREIAAGRLSLDSNRLPRKPRLARRDDVDWLNEFSESRRAELRTLGERAISGGRVAGAVLNGGMAMRFGGVVKGAVEAVDRRSFIEIKREQVRRAGRAPFVMMNSFATDAETLRHLEQRGITEGVRTFLQSVSVRLTSAGELFRDDSGSISPYAPGHGDFLRVVRASGTLDALRKSGIEVLMLSNVDNLGADLDPCVIGYHLAHGRPLTVELSETVQGDVGGAPAWVDGRLQVVEGFRFPAGFDFAQLPFMNANTFIMSLDLLESEYPLTWFYVEKRVGQRIAIQLEQLVGEVSAFVETAYLASPRTGPDCRFFPVKTQDDLDALQKDPDLRARLRDPGRESR